MYHKPLTIRQMDGLFRILQQRAVTIHKVDLFTLPEEVFHYVVDGTLVRVVRRKRWNMPAALEYFDNCIISYVARNG